MSTSGNFHKAEAYTCSLGVRDAIATFKTAVRQSDHCAEMCRVITNSMTVNFVQPHASILQAKTAYLL